MKSFPYLSSSRAIICRASNVTTMSEPDIPVAMLMSVWLGGCGCGWWCDWVGGLLWRVVWVVWVGVVWRVRFGCGCEGWCVWVGVVSGVGGCGLGGVGRCGLGVVVEGGV